jgi:hypothetical protein
LSGSTQTGLKNAAAWLYLAEFTFHDNYPLETKC